MYGVLVERVGGLGAPLSIALLRPDLIGRDCLVFGVRQTGKDGEEERVKVQGREESTGGRENRPWESDGDELRRRYWV